MHTEKYCSNLDNLDKAQAIRAIHQAYLQLNAIGSKIEVDGIAYDQIPALMALEKILASVGYAGLNKDH